MFVPRRCSSLPTGSIKGFFNMFNGCMGKGASDESAPVQTQQANTASDVDAPSDPVPGKKAEHRVTDEDTAQPDLAFKGESSLAVDVSPEATSAGIVSNNPGVLPKPRVSFCKLTRVVIIATRTEMFHDHESQRRSSRSVLKSEYFYTRSELEWMRISKMHELQYHEKVQARAKKEAAQRKVREVLEQKKQERNAEEVA